MTYDLRLGATVKGAEDVKLLADSVVLLAQKLPVLGKALEGFKGFGDIKSLNSASKVIDALNASVNSSDPAKIRAVATSIKELAAALAKMQGMQLPKGFSLGGGAVDFRAASNLKAMADSMAMSNQAVATSLAELSNTIRTGYAKAAKEAEAGAKKLKDTEAKEAKERAGTVRGQTAELQAAYEERLRAKAVFDTRELQAIRNAGIKLSAEHKLMVAAQDKTDLARLAEQTAGPLRGRLTAAGKLTQGAGLTADEIKQNDLASAALKAGEKYAAARAQQARMEAAADKIYNDQVRQREAENAATLKAARAAQRKLDAEEAAYAAEQARTQAAATATRERLKLASDKKNAAYKLADDQKRAQLQMQARAQLDENVPIMEVVRSYGSIATRAAKDAESLSALEQRFKLARDAAKGGATSTAEFKAQLTALAQAADYAYGKMSALERAEAALAANRMILSGKSNLEAQAKYGTEAVKLATTSTPTQLMKSVDVAAAAEAASKQAAKQAADTRAMTSALMEQRIQEIGKREEVERTNAALKQQAAAVDSIVAAERQAATAAKDAGAQAKINAREAANAAAAKKALLLGDDTGVVGAKYGQAALTKAQGTGLAELIQDSNRLNQTLAGSLPHANRMTAALQTMHSAARGVASGFGAMWLTWGQVAPILAGAALSHTLVSSVKQGVEFEHQLDIIRNLSGATSDQIVTLRQEMVNLSQGAVGPQKVAEAAKTLSLAGLKAGEVQVALKDVLNLAVAGTTDIGTAAEVMVAVSTAFGYSADQYGRVGDIIAKTAAISIADITDMSAAFKYSTTIAEQYHVSLEDVATSLAALAQRGIKGSSAGVAARQMFQEMTGATEKTAKLLKQFGIEAFEGTTDKLKPLLQLMYELEKSMDGLSKKDVSKNIRDMFNERASKGIVALKNDFDKSLKELNEFATRIDQINKAAAAAGDTGAPRRGLTSRDGKNTNMTGMEKMQELVALQSKGDIEGYADELRKLGEAGVIAESGLLGAQNAAYNTSAGFAALSEAGMALSAKNQLEAVKNTLQSSLIDAFTEIEPTVVTVAMRMQELFASAEFKQGVVDLATAIANLTGFLSENIGMVTAFVKAWMLKEVLATSAGLFSGLALSAASLGTNLTAASKGALDMGRSAGTLAGGLAAMNVAQTAAVGGAGRMLGLLGGLLGILSPLATALTVGYAAWVLFFRDGIGNISANDAAIGQLEAYNKKLDEQLRHLDKLAEARAKNISLQELESSQEFDKQINFYKKAADDAEKGLQEKLAQARERSAAMGVTDDNRNAILARGAPRAGSEGAITGRQFALVQAEAKLVKEIAENRAKADKLIYDTQAKQDLVRRRQAEDAAAARKRAQELGGDGSVGTRTREEEEKGARAAAAMARQIAQTEIDSYNLKLREYQDVANSMEAEARRFAEVQQALTKAGLQSQVTTDALILASAEQTAKKVSEAYARFRKDAAPDLLAAQEAIERAKSAKGKPKDDSRIAQAQERLREMERKTDELAAKDKHASTLRQLKPLAPEHKLSEDVDKFIATQEKSLTLSAEQASLKLAELGLTKEQVAANAALLKFQASYSEETAKLDKQIVETEKDYAAVAGNINKVKATLESMHRIGQEGSAEDLENLGRQQAALGNLEQRLTALTELRDKLYAAKGEGEQKIIDDVANAKIIDSMIVKLEQLKNRRDALVTGVEGGMKSAWDAAMKGEGGNVITKFTHAFGDALRQSVGDALWDALFKDNIKKGVGSLANLLFPTTLQEKQSQGGTNLFATEANKYLESKGEGGLLGGLEQGMNKITDNFKKIDWKGMWSKVTDAFGEIDWKSMWDAVKSLFGGASGSGDGGIGALIQTGIAIFGGGSGVGAGVGDDGLGPILTNAKGSAFSRARMFANGSAFAHQIVDTPTYFKYGLNNSLGVMGEAGPEAVMPLRRGSDGKLGIAASGGGGSTLIQKSSNYFTYNIGSGVTRADLAQWSAQTAAIAERRVAEGVRRNDGRFSRR